MVVQLNDKLKNNKSSHFVMLLLMVLDASVISSLAIVSVPGFSDGLKVAQVDCFLLDQEVSLDACS